MRVDARKNWRLRQQYPFVDQILKQAMEPFRVESADQKGGIFVDDLTIKVERADGDFLYRRGRNTGLGEDSFTFYMRGKHKDHISKCGQYVFAIDRDYKILNRLNFPRNREAARGQSTVHAFYVMWTSQSDDGRLLSNPIHDKTAYLVWVDVKTYHKNTGNDDGSDGRFGECLERSVAITIYLPPKEDFKKLEENSSHWSNLRLDSDILIKAIFENNHDITQMNGCLWELCKFFQDEVWDKGMKQAFEQFENDGVRGASGQFGTTKVLAAELCDYHRVMLQNDDCYISFQLRPGAIDMYVLGEDGTLPQLRQLVRSMVLMWIQQPECHADFNADTNVSVM